MKTAAASRKSDAFPTIEQIVELAAGLESEPAKILRNLVSDHGNDFGTVFKAFCESHPEYGFGDLQVKRIFDEVSAN